MKQTLTEKYFEDVYAANDDPWDFATSRYEAKKYDATLEALPRDRYENVFEIGCSIGVLTAKLAARCERLLAVDVSEKALAQARRRCGHLARVTFEKMTVPDEFPGEKFDLILISEVGYYFAPEDWRILMAKAGAHLAEKGHIALVHWLPEVHDYPQTGDEVHDSFAEFAAGRLKNVFAAREEKYRIEVWEKPLK